MYEVKKDNLFLFSKGETTFYKNGCMIAKKDNNTGKIKFFYGELQYCWLELTNNTNYHTYTQAHGWRIWKKHFPNRSVYSLPEYVQELLDLPCSSYGEYYSKKHKEWIGYAG